MKLFKLSIIIVAVLAIIVPLYSVQAKVGSYLSEQWQASKQLPSSLQDCLVKRDCTPAQKKSVILTAKRLGQTVAVLAAVGAAIYAGSKVLNADTYPSLGQNDQRPLFKQLDYQTGQKPLLDNLVTALNKSKNEQIKSYLSKVRFSQRQLNDFLMLAVQTSEPEIVRLFLENGALPGAVDGGGNSLLYWAARRITFTAVGKPDYERAHAIIDILLLYDAPLNKKGQDGKTPLIWVAGVGDKELVNKFLEKGADKNIRDNEGKRAYDYVALQGDLKELLK